MSKASSNKVSELKSLRKSSKNPSIRDGTSSKQLSQKDGTSSKQLSQKDGTSSKQIGKFKK